MFVSPHALTSRVVWHVTDKGWSSDFPPLPSAFSSKYSMAFMLRSHNGVHCCGTVGDSHSSSQLSTAKCTFTGDSFQNHGTKIVIFFESMYVFSKKTKRNIELLSFPYLQHRLDGGNQAESNSIGRESISNYEYFGDTKGEYMIPTSD